MSDETRAAAWQGLQSWAKRVDEALNEYRGRDGVPKVFWTPNQVQWYQE